MAADYMASYTITNTLANAFNISEVSLKVYAFHKGTTFGNSDPISNYIHEPALLAMADASVTADSSGNFSMTVVKPGLYHIVAQSVINSSAWYWTGNIMPDNFANLGDLTTASHLIAKGPATIPIVAAQVANGTTPPAPVIVTGTNDNRGNITFGSGATPAAGAQIVVTFGKPFTTTIPTINLTPTTAATIALGLYISARTLTSFTVAAATAPTASQAATIYGLAYIVEG